MEAAASLSVPSFTIPKTRVPENCTRTKSTVPFPARKSCKFSVNSARRRRGERVAVAVINDVSTNTMVLDSAPVEVTWQIVVGAIAGFTPFVVAGIEFSKRIIAQRRCESCGGSGLILMEKEYVRCPGCGWSSCNF